eukprot:gene33388-43165_t
MSIRFIDFEKFKSYGKIPRCPNQLQLCSDIREVQNARDSSLIVFISHRWLRSQENHPDDPVDNKFNLIVEGLEKVKKSFCPDMQSMYVWLDFSSIDQDGNKMGELKLLDQIIQFCDIMFTPIVDDLWESRTYDIGPGWMMTYPAPWWCDTQIGYRNRGWCRLEMYLAANEPLLPSDALRLGRMQAGLRTFAEVKKVRAHILYGTRESKSRLPPILLPPFQNDLYEKLNPLAPTAFITNENDRQYIQELMGRNSRKVVQEGYEGQRNTAGQMHGEGKYTYADGNIYEGAFVEDKKQGKGKYTYTSGATYEGDFAQDTKHGQGKYTYASGNIYEGAFLADKKHGRGKVAYANGDAYEGEWAEDKRHGKGKLTYASGVVYDGDFVADKKHGRGKVAYASGNTYEGDFVTDKKHGFGKQIYASGEIYDGEWRNDKKHGKGKVLSANGDVYVGEWVGGKRQGNGTVTYANRDVYDGEWMNDKRHGKGKVTYPNGEVFVGEWVVDLRNGEGKLIYPDGRIHIGTWEEDKIIDAKHLVAVSRPSACCSIM